VTETKKPHVYLTDRFFAAMSYASEAHKEQVRKSTDIAYISHPFGVASLVIEAGGDEDQAIAGLLHDVAEDCGGEPRLTEIAEKFGDRVAHIVRGCSDSLVVEEDKKAPWRDRKEAHIEHLRSSNSDVLLVTAADKTHNARAISTDIQSIGNKVWDRFNSDQEQILWYYKSVYEVLSDGGVTSTLLNPLKTAIGIMEKSGSQ
jgi:(p)ppGpp synthase/HD superfamily hydrolase